MTTIASPSNPFENCPLSFDVLCEHYRNCEKRIQTLRGEIDQDTFVYYSAMLRNAGLKVGDRVMYHNYSYHISEHAILATNIDGDIELDFALARFSNGTSLRWLPIDFIDELKKIKD